ncbi:MAG: ComF family protein [Candidatus Latescibacterota bacterium]|jgi:ComF family protein
MWGSAGLHWLGTALLDFVYPPVCTACSAALDEAAELLCPLCWAAIADGTRAVHGRCGRCGCPAIAPGASCTNCSGWEVAFDRAVVLGRFDGPLQQAVHALKFSGRRSLGPALGRSLARHLGPELTVVDLLVPVPLHPARQRERGFNQSALIAAGLGEELGRPVAGDLVVRRVQTRQQARLDAVARQDNLRDAFACPVPVPGDRCLCLVDDVLTTGATLDACARALRQAGARTVLAATLAGAYR